MIPANITGANLLSASCYVFNAWLKPHLDPVVEKQLNLIEVYSEVSIVLISICANM